MTPDEFRERWAYYAAEATVYRTMLDDTSTPADLVQRTLATPGPEGRGERELDLLARIAWKMIADAGLLKPPRGGWVFAFLPKAARTVGLTRHSQDGSGTIFFSEAHARYAPFEVFRSTMIHEIAHGLCGYEEHHGPTWKATAIALGDDGDRCHRDYSYLPPETVKIRPYRWRGTCPNGHVHLRKNRSKRPQSCGRCSKRYDPAFLLIYEEITAPARGGA